MASLHFSTDDAFDIYEVLVNDLQAPVPDLDLEILPSKGNIGQVRSVFNRFILRQRSALDGKFEIGRRYVEARQVCYVEIGNLIVICR